MQLYCEQTGPQDAHTPCLVLLHGWGLHSGVMAPLAETLSQHYHVINIDLPGHGYSDCESQKASTTSDSVLDRWNQAILGTLDHLGHVSTRFHWVGWSLGGRLALQLCALYPQRCKSLVTIASNPQFVSDKHWPHGMTRADFEDFRQRTNENPPLALQRFLHLIASNNRDSRNLARQLKENLNSKPFARIEGLDEGLQLLDTLHIINPDQITMPPWLALFATHDPLIPDSAALAIQRLASINSTRFQGHAGWMSETPVIAEQIHQFVKRNSNRNL